MKDEDKTKRELVAELALLRERNTELERSEGERDLLYAVLDAIPDYSIYAKDCQSRFIAANRTALRNMQEPTRQYVLGKTDLDLIPRWLAEYYYAEEQGVIASGVGVCEKEVWGTYEVEGDGAGQPRLLREGERALGGGRRWCTIYSKVPLRDKTGKIAGIACIHRNLTDAKLREERLRSQRDLLEQVVAERTAELTKANERLREEIEARKLATERLWRTAALDQVRVSVYKMERGSDLQQVLVSVDKALRLAGVPLQESSVQIVNEANGVLESAWHGGDRFDCVGSDRVVPRPLGETPAYAAWQGGRPVHRRDLSREDPYEEYETANAHAQVRSVVDVPFSHGTVAVNSREADAFSDTDIETVEQVAHVLSEAYTRFDDMGRTEDSERKYRTLVEHSQDVIFWMDAEENLLLVSPAAAKLTGHTPEEFYQEGTLWRGMVHPGDVEKVDGARKKAFAGRRPKDVEFRVRKGRRIAWLSQTVFPIRDAQGRIVAIEGTLRDVTKRKRAEKAERHGRYLVDVLMEHTPDMVHMKDMHGRFIRVSESVAHHMGLSGASEAVGRTDSEFFTEEHARSTQEDERRVMATGQPLEDVEERETWIDGRVTWVSTTKVPLRNSEGAVIGTFGISRDITERKRADEALAQERNLLRTLIDNLPDAVFVKDTDGRFVIANKATVQDLGAGAEEEVLGRTDLDFLSKEVATGLLAEERRILASGQPMVSEERVVLGPGGEVLRTLLSSKVPLRDTEGRIVGLVGANRDVSERRRTAEALRRSEERYREVVEAQTELVNRSLPDGTLTFVNEACARYFGRRPEEMIGKSFLPWVPAEEHERLAKYFAQFSPENPIGTMENRAARADGETRWQQWSNRALFDEAGALVEFQSVGRDITERVRAEEALKKSEARYRALYDEAPVGYHEIDLEGNLLRVNRAEAEMLGYAVKEMTGRSALDFVSAGQRQLVRRSIREKLQGQRALEAFERRYVRKDGTEIDVQIEDRLIFDEGGCVSGIRSTLQDITERKRAENALRESEENLRALFNAASESIALLGVDGVFLACNQTAARRFGKKPEELVGLKTSGVMSRELERSRRPRMKAVARTGRPLQFEDELAGRVYFNSFYPVKDQRGRVSRIAVFSADVTRQRQAEQRLMAYQQQLRSLASELLLTEERERREHATALHDSIGQTLAICKIKLGVLREAAFSRGLGEAVEEIRQLVEQCIEATRSLALQLSPPVLYELGFVAALEWLVEWGREQFGMPIEFETEAVRVQPEEEIGLFLFRSARELLVNVAKHARARRAKVSVREDGAQVRVTIEDDGVGFDTSEVGSQKGSTEAFGLFSIRERLSYVGGQLLMDSRPGRGTQATLVAPLRRSRASQSYE